MKRKKVNQNAAKKLFSHTASQTRPQNTQAVPMRGGFRL